MWPELDPYNSARDLLGSIVTFGENGTNPVLTILEDETPHETHRYPPEGIIFGDKLWRAYYHSHQTPENDPDEHGHFHIFTRFDEDGSDWTHVAGLSVDQFGQPLDWFMANKWVVSGAWHSAEFLSRNLTTPGVSSDANPVGHWIAAMLGTFRDEIDQMLIERDRFVAQHTNTSDRNDVFEDRSIWRLARHKIDLHSKLNNMLVHEQDGSAAH